MRRCIGVNVLRNECIIIIWYGFNIWFLLIFKLFVLIWFWSNCCRLNCFFYRKEWIILCKSYYFRYVIDDVWILFYLGYRIGLGIYYIDDIWIYRWIFNKWKIKFIFIFVFIVKEGFYVVKYFFILFLFFYWWNYVKLWGGLERCIVFL